MRIRPAAVAGTFYPADPAVLRQQVEQLLAENPVARDVPPAQALIAPHAGYIYSGPIAARAYNRIAAIAADIERVVLLGPAHFVPVRGLALPQAEAFATPLGEVPLDGDMMARLALLPQVQRSAFAHAHEHSIEVQLPFLQVLLGHFRLVPLLVGEATPDEVAEVIELARSGLESREALLVISSDLSHYHAYDEALRLDAATDQLIVSGVPRLHGEQACGCHPVNGLLHWARRQGLQAERLDLRNSGDTAGDRRRVVGYGAWAFSQ